MKTDPGPRGRASDAVGGQGGLRFCISDQVPGDADRHTPRAAALEPSFPSSVFVLVVSSWTDPFRAEGLLLSVISY